MGLISYKQTFVRTLYNVENTQPSFFVFKFGLVFSNVYEVLILKILVLRPHNEEILAELVILNL